LNPAEIDKAIASHGIVPIPNHGNAYGYEVNGYGAYYNMDDANVPSLLSLPYLVRRAGKSLFSELYINLIKR
jgi:meiotically up-regulated gene 157 (Mug157) protein